MNKHCSNEVLSGNRPEIQMQSWIIFERKIGKIIFLGFLRLSSEVLSDGKNSWWAET